MKSLLESYLGCRLRLARMVGRIVRPEEIEDIVQETFVTSYAASRGQEIRNPQAFMMRVARHLRRQWRPLILEGRRLADH